MSVRVIAVRKINGYHNNPHEAISHYEWVNEGPKDKDSGISDRPVMVKWVEEGGRVYVTSTAATVDCYVNHSAQAQNSSRRPQTAAPQTIC